MAGADIFNVGVGVNLDMMAKILFALVGLCVRYVYPFLFWLAISVHTR